MGLNPATYQLALPKGSPTYVGFGHQVRLSTEGSAKRPQDQQFDQLKAAAVAGWLVTSLPPQRDVFELDDNAQMYPTRRYARIPDISALRVLLLLLSILVRGTVVNIFVCYSGV